MKRISTERGYKTEDYMYCTMNTTISNVSVSNPDPHPGELATISV